MVNSGYELTAYFNTGFNGVDIPADASVLETATKRVYNDNYFLREDIDKPFIKVNDTYANLRDCDYVKLTPKTGNTGGVTCYFFCVPTADAHGTTILALELDALLTMGGAKNLTYISGWQERGHIAKSEDELFSNIAPESFAPRKPLIVRGGEIDLDTTNHYSNDVSLIVSTVDLTDTATGDQVDVITGVDGLGDEKMYFPQIKVNPDTLKTSFREVTNWVISGNTETWTLDEYNLPSTTAFLYSNADVKNGLKALYSAGQLSLMAAYIIPKEFLPSTPYVIFSAHAGKLQSVNGIYQKVAPSDTDFVFEFDIPNYTVKNKKALALFHEYMIANIASGGSITKDAHDLYKTGDSAPKIFIWADPSPNGKPMARFSYEKDATNIFSDVVFGAPWYQQQLVFEGASGSLWNSINAAFANGNLSRNLQENKLLQQFTNEQYGRDLARLDYNSRFAFTGAAIDTAFGAAKGGAGLFSNIMGGDVGGAISSGLDMAQGAINGARNMANIASQYAMNKADVDAQNAYNRANQALAQSAINQAINENKVGLLKNNSIVSPTVLFTPTDNLSLYGLNKFKAYHITMDDDDIKEFDSYLQRYGYNGIHRPLTKECFNTRQYYSYVQAFDVNIKSSFGLRIRQKAISQLNGGVRVWKVLPDAQYYETN